MAIKKASEIITGITNDLADNNAGAISASDIRTNMLDIVDSIVPIVGSGDFQTHPFTSTIHFNDIILSKSGIKFDTDDTSSFSDADKFQTVPFRGVGNIKHNTLGGLTEGDPHVSQYISVSGINKMIGNFALGTISNTVDTAVLGGGWMNASGDTISTATNNLGIGFAHTASGQIIHIGSGNYGGVEGSFTTLNFDVDNSTMFTARGNTQAWVNFDGTSGNLAARSCFNISALEASGDGTYKVYLKDGLFTDGNYIVVANANGTAGNSSARDMDIVNITSVVKTKDYFTIAIQDDTNSYIDSKVIDVAVYGNASGVTGDDTSALVITQKTFN